MPRLNRAYSDQAEDNRSYQYVAHTGPGNHQPPVGPVGDHPGENSKSKHGDPSQDKEKSHLERAVGLLQYQQAHRHRVHPAAGVVQRAGSPKKPEIPITKGGQQEGGWRQVSSLNRPQTSG